jgi:hypothetical protein
MSKKKTYFSIILRDLYYDKAIILYIKTPAIFSDTAPISGYCNLFLLAGIAGTGAGRYAQ